MGKDKALTLALEALKWCHGGEPCGTAEAITAIKEALAQPEQEPWATREDFYCELNRRVERMRKEMEIKTVTMRCKEYDIALPIIEAHFGHVFVGQVFKPPQRPWVGLDHDELIERANQEECASVFSKGAIWGAARLREKNA